MRQNERSGLLFALAGFALLSCGDAVIKTMTGMWAPTAIATTRYVLGAVGLGALLAHRQGAAGFTMQMPWVQLARGAAVGMATVGFFSAVFVMPLSEATSITFTSPMITALLAALFLGEPARRETWIASFVAFAGVLIVLRPNFAELGWAALLPLMSAVGMSVLMICNRAAAGKATPLAMQFFVAAMASPLLIAASLIGHGSGIGRFALHWPHWSVVARCAVVACSASFAHWFIYMGTTRAGAASIAPMTYVQLIVALTLGWALFGDVPDAVSMLGAAVIVGAGLFLWWSGRTRQPG
ncbi:MAG: DMT family transporter [Sphingomonadales bacterium]|nr:DMT family transporter [Sphingomonadales bacterium]